MSIKWGLATKWDTAFAVATKLKGGINTSSFGKPMLSPSVPDWLYFTNIVISSTPSSGGKTKFFIVPTIPEFWPITLVPFPLLLDIISFK